MKKMLFFLWILSGIVILSGCTNTHSNVDEPLLELQHFIDIDSAEGIEIQSKTVSIPYDATKETAWASVLSATSLDDILAVIQADYPDINFENWEYNVHLIADDGSWGMVRLRYKIGADITTNKVVMYIFSNGYIDEISYTNMGFTLTDAEEQEIIRRADNFLRTHTQEKKILEEEERLLEEQTTIAYYYNIDKLVYTYALFFEYRDDELWLINNDYGSEYIIE